MATISRRRLLKTTGSVVLGGAIGGCSGSESTGGDETPTPDSTSTETPTVVDEATATPTSTPTPASETNPPSKEIDRKIHVIAKSFKFIPGSTHKGEEPIRVKKGQRIKLRVTAKDAGIGSGHGFGLPAYDINLLPILPDKPKSTVFTADKAGKFKFRCTVQCSQPGAGSGHSSMYGYLIVES